MVYPTLTLLEELGHAAVAASDGARRLYAITADGAAWLAASGPALAAMAERLAPATAAVLCAVMDQRQVCIERDGITARAPCAKPTSSTAPPAARPWAPRR